MFTMIGDICAHAGVTMEAAFVPFSRSRNAKPGKDGKAWRSLNWRIRLFHRRSSAPILEAEMIAHEIETGRVATGHHWARGVSGGKPIPAPSIGDVMQSLAMDSDVLDYAGFEDWAGEFGYDADSRSAESIYRACVEIATKLRAGLGAGLLAEIRLAASFN